MSHTLDFGRGTAFVSGARGPLTVTGLMLQGAGWAANYSAEANGSVAAAQLQTRLWPFNTSSGSVGAREMHLDSPDRLCEGSQSGCVLRRRLRLALGQECVRKRPCNG